MRTIIILSFLFVSGFSFSQKNSEPDSQAEFPGGQTEMSKFIQENIRIPAKAYKKRVDGKCYVRFVVTESGNITNVVVQVGVENCAECDQEAVRVVKSMPNWIPGTVDGKAVNSWFTLPIVFKLV